MTINMPSIPIPISLKAIKRFGFYGYRYSTESEPIKIHQLLFLKAYALGNMEARELTVVDEGLDCCKSNFDKELNCCFLICNFPVLGTFDWCRL